MIEHILPDFMQDDLAYAQAERYWVQLWLQLDPDIRGDNGWIQPWFRPLTRSLGEGNPIFSAVSPARKRGIRIIQFEPTSPRAEIVAYADTFGGPFYDPSAISELVISCALSDVTAAMALSLMRPWIAGQSVSFDLDDDGLSLVDRRAERTFGDDFPLAA